MGALGVPQLYQNVPNPFSEQSVIGFYLPKAEEVELEVRTIEGQLLWENKQLYPNGYNAIVLTREQIGQRAGTLLYSLKTSTDHLTKKMIVVKR